MVAAGLLRRRAVQRISRSRVVPGDGAAGRSSADTMRDDDSRKGTALRSRAEVESCSGHTVMCRDIPDGLNPRWYRRLVFGVVGLIVAIDVGGEIADLAGGGVDDADVEVDDEHDDGLPTRDRPMPMWLDPVSVDTPRCIWSVRVMTYATSVRHGRLSGAGDAAKGKSDRLDSLRIARETQADSAMPTAFKRAAGDAGPDETHELIALWHKARRSIVTSRRHLLNEAEQLLCELPEALRAVLPDRKAVRPRLRALPAAHPAAGDPPTLLRLRLLHRHATTIAELDRQDREAAAELRDLAQRARLDTPPAVRDRSTHRGRTTRRGR